MIKNNRSIMKYQGGNKVLGMTDAENKIMQQKMDAFNQASVDHYMRGLSEDEKKNFTTQYQGKFKDTGKTMSSYDWELMNRDNPQSVNTMSLDSEFHKIFGDKEEAPKGDNDPNFPVNNYKILEDEKGQKMYVAQYGTAFNKPDKTQFKYRQFDLGSVAENPEIAANMPKQLNPNAKAKDFYRTNPQTGKTTYMTEDQYNSYSAKNKQAAAAYDADMKAYNQNVDSFRQRGYFDDNQGIAQFTPAQKRGGILYK